MSTVKRVMMIFILMVMGFSIKVNADMVVNENQQIRTVVFTSSTKITLPPKKDRIYQNRWVNVEVSHYSELEPTDEPGCGPRNALGGYLKDGDLAMPTSVPFGTVVLLKDNNGNIIKNNNGEPKRFTRTDSGNPKCVKLYDSDTDKARLSKKLNIRPSRGLETPKLPEMRIDLFVQGASFSELDQLGLKYYQMYVVRWGWDGHDKMQNNI